MILLKLYKGEYTLSKIFWIVWLPSLIIFLNAEYLTNYSAFIALPAIINYIAWHGLRKRLSIQTDIDVILPSLLLPIMVTIELFLIYFMITLILGTIYGIMLAT